MNAPPTDDPRALERRTRSLQRALAAAAVGVVALLLGAVFLRRSPSPPVPVDAPVGAPPRVELRAAFDAACREASRSSRDVLVWCHDRYTEEDGFGSPRPQQATARRVFAHRAAREAIERAFVVVELSVAAATPVDALPVELQRRLGFDIGLVGSSPPSASAWAGSAAMLSVLLLADANGRLWAETAFDENASERDCAAELVKLRSVRERRDTAFARAAITEGPVRAHALADGLTSIARRIVLLCYRDELEEIGHLDPDSGGEDVAALVRAARALPGVMAIQRIVFSLPPDKRARSRAELRAAFDSVLREYGAVPEVQQMATVWLATADVRTAANDAALANVRAEIDAAIALAPDSEVVPMLEELSERLGELRRRR